MLNVVIPMAGRGSRFAQAGYSIPKPLIPIHGVRMVDLVCHNLKPSSSHRYIFLVLAEHLNQYPEIKKLGQTEDNVIVPVNQVTEGAACTVLLAKHLINSDDGLMIANSDQWINFDINEYLKPIKTKNLDGLIMTMEASDPKWSFVRKNAQGFVSEVAEKKVISQEATVGIYNFTRGRDFVAAAEEMIKKNLRVNNEFYVAPTYNQLIEQGMKIGSFDIGPLSERMYGLGTPEDLEIFLKNPISHQAVGKN